MRSSFESFNDFRKVPVDPLKLEWTPAKVKELADGLGLLHDKVHKDLPPNPLSVSYPLKGWIPVTEKLPGFEEEVLAYYEDPTFKNPKKIVRACYYPEKTLESDGFIDFDYDEETGMKWAPAGWYEAVEMRPEYLYPIEYEVTHWLPLPQPPRLKCFSK